MKKVCHHTFTFHLWWKCYQYCHHSQINEICQ